jgi:2-keto-4-pentenoate hydratase
MQLLAQKLMSCHSQGALLPPPSASCQALDVTAAYRVLDAISARRRATGWQAVGHKIGFTNRSIWARYGVSHPIWAPMWSNTVRFADEDHATLGISALAQPRIEPEVVFKLKGPVPVTDDAEVVLRSVEWLAPGFEIVQCHYPGWQFSAPDCIVDFGLHAALVIGTPAPIAAAETGRWASALASFSATLLRGTATMDRGGGALVLGSPLLALAWLARQLEASGQPALGAGGIVTTGTLTDAWPVTAGETWSADYSSLATRPLSIRFT